MVMAHEMGHYVLNHVGKFLVNFTLLFALGFALTGVVFDASVRRWGATLGGVAASAIPPVSRSWR